MDTSIIICALDEIYLPKKHTPGAVCRDLSIRENIDIAPWHIILAPTWIKIACPLWRHTKIYARSGLPIKSWLMLANGVWVIDTDYRGEYFLQLLNITTQHISFPSWSRLGQLEIVPCFLPEQAHTLIMPPIKTICDQKTFADFESIYPTSRGGEGFHSTGR